MSGKHPTSGAEELFIASRGAGPGNGLVRSTWDGDRWHHSTLAVVDQLSALAWHPTLPVMYGTAGQDRVGGQVLAWRIEPDKAHLLTDIPSGREEREPCHVAVDPAGRFVVVANYSTGQLALWRTDDHGALVGDPVVVQLTGSGPESDRQEAAHPHQIVFDDDVPGRMLVVDLGADLIRVFDVTVPDAISGASGIDVIEVASKPVPPGTGPRHLVQLPGGRYGVSGELRSNLLVGRLDESSWSDVSSTTRTGPAQVRHERNYPGDIQRSRDGRYVYFANRSYGTIAVFDVEGDDPRLIVERDAKVDWPQHIFVRDDDILVAGWDSSQVSCLPLRDGIPSEAHILFSVPGPGWILPSQG